MSKISSAVFVLSLIFSPAVLAQDATHPGAAHSHPPEHAQLHEQFYTRWVRPDGKGSCCNNRDCYPTKAKFENGLWWAVRREDGKWLPIPKSIYDADKPGLVQSPDGQAHLCAPPPNLTTYPKDFIFCFTAGTGI